MRTLLDMLRRFPAFQPRDTFGSPNRALVEILARASLAVPPMSEGVARRLAAWLGSVVEALAALDGTLSRLRDEVRDLKPAVAQARIVEALRPLVDRVAKAAREGIATAARERDEFERDLLAATAPAPVEGNAAVVAAMRAAEIRAAVAVLSPTERLALVQRELMAGRVEVVGAVVDSPLALDVPDLERARLDAVRATRPDLGAALDELTAAASVAADLAHLVSVYVRAAVSRFAPAVAVSPDAFLRNAPEPQLLGAAAAAVA